MSELTIYSEQYICTAMAGTMRDASLHFIRRYHNSIAITGIGRILPSFRFRTLNLLPSDSRQGRGSQRYNYNISLYCSGRPFSGRPADDGSTKSRTGVASLSHGSLDSMDFAEPKRWSRGGGLFDVSAHIDPTAIIESGALVQAHAKLGPNVRVGSGSVVGPSVSIGSSTRIGYNVSLQNCSIGDFCIIHNGVCVGQDGFGHFVDEQGMLVKKPQLLYAKIGNHVELGANVCIDRGSWRDTEIGDHTKIDNLVQIGHNVVIGRCCMLCGQVGVAGSVTMGDYVVLGGNSGVTDHVSIVSKVRLAAKSCVTKNIDEPGDYAGFPAVHIREWRKSIIAFRKIGRDPKM